MHWITEIWWIAAVGSYDLTVYACFTPFSEHLSPYVLRSYGGLHFKLPFPRHAQCQGS